MSIGQKLLHGTFWTTVGVVVSRVMALVTIGIIGRILGKEGFGYYSIVTSTVLLLTPLAAGGQFSLAARNIGLWKITDKQRCGGVIPFVMLTSGLAGTVFAAAMFLSSEWLANTVLREPGVASYLRVVSPYVLLGALATAGSGVLVGFRGFREQAETEFLSSIFAFPATVVLAWRLGMLGGIIGLLLYTGCKVFLLHHFGAKLSRANGISRSWGMVTVLLPLLGTFVVPSLLTYAVSAPALWGANALLVREPGGPAQMGIFGASNYLRGAVLFLPSAIAPVMLPLMMETAGESKDPTAFHRVVSMSVRLNVLLVCPVSVFLVVAAKGVLYLVYGQGFVEGHHVLGLMAWAIGFQAISTSVIQAMIGRAKMWLFFLVNLISSLVLILSAWLFVGRWGAEGLATSHVVGWAIQLIVALVIRAKFLDAPIAFSEWRLLIASVGALLLAGVVGAYSTQVIGLVLGVPMSVGAGLLLLTLGFAKSERSAAFRLLRSRLAVLIPQLGIHDA